MIGYQKAASGIQNSKNKGQTLIDPQVGGNELEDLLRHFQQKLDLKFSQTQEVFRQFDIRQTGHVTFSDFCFILDQLSIRFGKGDLIKMFTYMDDDKDNKLTY